MGKCLLSAGIKVVPRKLFVLTRDEEFFYEKKGDLYGKTRNGNGEKVRSERNREPMV